MRSVVAETIDIVIGKSHGALEKISVEDIVIGVFFTGVKLSTGHPALTDVPVNPARYCNDVKDEVSGAYCKACEPEHTHLIGKEEKRSGDAAHGSEEGNHKRNQRRNFHARDRKIHWDTSVYQLNHKP
jgi:hypothetical protein